MKDPLQIKATVTLDGLPAVEKAQSDERKFCPPTDAITQSIWAVLRINIPSGDGTHH